MCLDDDKAGMLDMARLEQAVREDPELSQRMELIYHTPPPAEYGKDYNEFLFTHIQTTRTHQQQREGAR